MSVPPIRPTAIAVYVYRKTPHGIDFLQIRRSAVARGHQQSWQTVYGGIEPLPADPTQQETAIAAALRELREETGLTPIRFFQVEYLETFYFQHSDSILLMPVFAAEVPPDAVIVLNNEHDGHRWIPEAQIAQHFMWRTQREALKFLLEALRNPGPAMAFLTIPMPRPTA